MKIRGGDHGTGLAVVFVLWLALTIYIISQSDDLLFSVALSGSAGFAAIVALAQRYG